SGVLRRIVVQTGTTVPVRTLIAEIGEPGEAATEAPTSAPPAAQSAAIPQHAASTAGGPGDLPPVEASPREVAMANAAAESRSHVAPSSGSGSGGARLFASPRARMRARAMGLELATVQGSGPHGRIVEADVFGATAVTDVDTRIIATPLARRLAQ